MRGLALFFLLMAVGTFLYFPRLAKALVGVALTVVLIGGLALAVMIVHEEYIAKPAREAAAAQASAEADSLYKAYLAEELAARYATPAERAASAAQGKADFERLYGTPTVLPVAAPPPARPRAPRR